MQRITEPEGMTVGQLYMFEVNDTLERGYCTAIYETKVRFKIRTREEQVVIPFRDMNTQKPSFISTYDANIYKRYKILLEQQAKERHELLNGKPIILDKIAKERTIINFIKMVMKRI
jgi:hypothetical protein